MQRIIIGTAGHIDHGKTMLVEALTGIDCDRWIEEKERGITIDLGFAYLRHNELQLGFIDVPGHERFVHNALAGLGGIRVVLLVVAADEGVKPQTREHIDICSLLEIPACLVALTKSDLATEEILELAQMEVDELLGSTPFAGAEILTVSSKTGDGIPELRERLLQLAVRHAADVDPDRPARIPIDRAFHLKGLGVVVTGTLVSGLFKPGDNLELLPGEKKARIRSVQVHGEQRQQAEAGERTALQLSGVGLEDLHRGVQLVTSGEFRTTKTLLGRFTLLDGAPKVIKGSTSIRLHLYSSEVLGRLRPLQGPLAPGATGAVEIRLSQPVVAVRGDRFIVRRPSPPTTLGGGEILDPQWHRHRGKELETALVALSGEIAEALEFWVQEGMEAGVETRVLARRLGLVAAKVEESLQQLAAAQRILRVTSTAGQGTRWLAPDVYRRVAERAEKVLGSYFRRQRLATGMPKAEAVKRILPSRAVDLADTYIQWLQAQKILVVTGDTVNLPGRAAEMTGEESQLAKDIVTHFDAAGLKPPPPGKICEVLGAKPQIFDGVVQYLLEKGDLTRLPGGLLISSSALRAVKDDLRTGSQDRFSVGDFKSRYQLTRKWAIPILEHLDSAGITRRVGDQRQVVRSHR